MQPKQTEDYRLKKLVLTFIRTFLVAGEPDSFNNLKINRNQIISLMTGFNLYKSPKSSIQHWKLNSRKISSITSTENEENAKILLWLKKVNEGILAAESIYEKKQVGLDLQKQDPSVQEFYTQKMDIALFKMMETFDATWIKIKQKNLRYLCQKFVFSNNYGDISAAPGADG